VRANAHRNSHCAPTVPGESGADLLIEDAGEGGDLRPDLGAAVPQLLVGRAAIERTMLPTRLDLELEAAYSLHEELVVEHSHDPRELDPLE
jgi:hypothetical protein